MNSRKPSHSGSLLQFHSQYKVIFPLITKQRMNGNKQGAMNHSITSTQKSVGLKGVNKAALNHSIERKQFSERNQRLLLHGIIHEMHKIAILNRSGCLGSISKDSND